MTLRQIIDRQAFLLQYDLDNYVNASTGATLTDAQATGQVNEAIRAISLIVNQYDPSIVFTLTAGESTYDIRDVTSPIVGRKVIEPRQVIINSLPLRDALGQDYGVWAINELQLQNPNWRAAGNATPFAAAFYDTTVILYPPPTQGVIDTGNNFIAGTYMAADMDSVLSLPSSPDLPEELHPAIACLSAILAAEPTVSAGEAMGRIGLYDKRAGEALEKVRRRNANSQSPIGRSSQTRNDYMQA